MAIGPPPGMTDEELESSVDYLLRHWESYGPMARDAHAREYLKQCLPRLRIMIEMSVLPEGQVQETNVDKDDKDILEVLDEGYEYAKANNGDAVVGADVLYAAAREIRRLREGSNYVVDREAKPTCVWFRNGRRVSIVGKPGDHYLDVQTPPRLGLSYGETGGE